MTPVFDHTGSKRASSPDLAQHDRARVGGGGERPTRCVRCHFCASTGFLKLTGVHSDTLDLLASQSAPISGASLARLAGCQATAMNMRLHWLEQAGFATSGRYGRERRFVALANVERRPADVCA